MHSNLKNRKMKKVVLSGLFALVMGFSFSQNVENVAKKAAQDAGCIEANGAFTYQVSNIGVCASGPATTSVWTEVLILPKVSANEAPYVRLAPVARVTLCGSVVLTTECL